MIDAYWKKDHAEEVGTGKIWKDTKFYALGKGRILVESEESGAGIYINNYFMGRSLNDPGAVYLYQEGEEREDIEENHGFLNFHRVYKVVGGKWVLDRELDPPVDD